jgi:hypothetical protein
VPSFSANFLTNSLSTILISLPSGMATTFLLNQEIAQGCNKTFLGSSNSIMPLSTSSLNLFMEV